MHERRFRRVGDTEDLAENIERRRRFQVEIDAAGMQRGEELLPAARLIDAGGIERLAEKRTGKLKISVKRCDGAESVAGVFVRKRYAHREGKLCQIGGDAGFRRCVAREPVLCKLIGRLSCKVADKRRLDEKKHGGNGQDGNCGILQVAHRIGVLIHGFPPRRWAA